MKPNLHLTLAIAFGALGSAVGCLSASSNDSATAGAQNGPGMGTSSDGTRGPTPTMSSASPEADQSSFFVPDEPEDTSEGPRPFVYTDYDPLSTFAADVDTASYDLFRRDALQGNLPDPSSVRVEEYVNYFDYDYPAPEEAASDPFRISLAAASGLLERDTTWLRVGIQGRMPPPESSEPQEANLVFLVDVSGSMSSSDKLPLAQRVLRETLEILDPEATISIVTYSTDARVALSPTPVSDTATLESAIDGLVAGGSTAGSAGLDLAYGQAESALIEGGINHVVLCTDGDFNVGPSSTEELLAQIELKRKSGITLTVLGFGSDNLNDSMMEAVSNAGNGVYGVITDPDQAIDYVHHRLLSTINFIAKDVKIQVEFNAEHVLAYRLVGYENRAIEDTEFRNDAVDAGEVGEGHRVTALYELVLDGGTVPEPKNAPAPQKGDTYSGDLEVSADDLVLVKVRYKQVDATEEDPAREIAVSLGSAKVGEGDQDFEWAVAVASLAEILRQSPYAEQDALPRIEGILTDGAYAEDPARAELGTLFDNIAGKLSE